MWCFLPLFGILEYSYSKRSFGNRNGAGVNHLTQNILVVYDGEIYCSHICSFGDIYLGLLTV